MSNHVHGGDIYRYKNVMDFSSNCNPFGTPESVKKAICRAAEDVHNYPDVEYTRLKEKLAGETGIPEESIFCGNGAAEVIFCATSALKPKKALIPVPAFAEYEQALRACGCTTDYYMLSEEKGFRPGYDFIDRIDETTDVVFICNPANPTGVLLDREFVETTAVKCRENGAVLILDECFLDFVEDKESYTMTGLLEEYPNMLILKAFTKLYAMAGVRLGYGLCSDKAFIEKMRDSVQPWNVSTPAQYAGIAALDEKEYVNKSLTEIRSERDRLRKAVEDIGFTVYQSSANYIFFRGQKDLWEKCLAEGVLLRDCSNYRGLEKGYYRAAVRLKEENDRLIEVLRKVKD